MTREWRNVRWKIAEIDFCHRIDTRTKSMRIACLLAILTVPLLWVAGCTRSDPLLAQFLAQRDAMAANNWIWVSNHLSQEFLAAHVGDLLLSSDPADVSNARTWLIHVLASPNGDVAVCNANSEYSDFGRRGILTLTVRPTNGVVTKIGYDYKLESGVWRLNQVIFTSPKSNPILAQHYCSTPMLSLPPIAAAETLGS